MKRTRTAEAIWIASKSYWQIKVQKDGIRKAFTCSETGRKGKHKAEAKADRWLEEGTSDMRLDKAWKLFCDSKIGPDPKHPAPAFTAVDGTGRVHVLPRLGTKKLSNITPVLWQTVLDSAVRKGLSRVTIQNIKGHIMSFYKYARRARWDIPLIEDGDICVPKSAPPKKQKHAISPEIIRAIFDDPSCTYYGSKSIHQYAYAIQFAIVTGMRRGEIVGLKTSDINGNLLSINRSVNGHRLITPGKNDNARRTIELTPSALAVLDRQREYLKSHNIISSWIFPDRYGEMGNPLTMYRQWEKWCSEHEISATFHEIRHTFISLNKSDLPLDLMKAVVGHSSKMDTLGIYGHELESDRHRAAQIVEGVFEKIIAAK